MRPFDELLEHVLDRRLGEQRGDPAVDRGSRPGGEHRLDPLQLVREHRVQRSVDVDRREEQVGEVVGERRLNVGLLVGVGGEVGDPLTARHRCSRPDRHRADHEEEDGEHPDD